MPSSRHRLDMSIKENFNKIGNKVVQTFRPKNGIKETNIIKANEKIAELEKQLETPKEETPKVSKAKSMGEKLLDASADYRVHKDTEKYLAENEAIMAEYRTEPMFEDNIPSPKQTPTLPIPKSTARHFYGQKEVMASVVNNNVEYRVASVNDEHKIAKAQPYFIVKQGYYVMFESGKVYFLKTTDQGQRDRNNVIKTLPNRLMASSDTSTNGAKVYTGQMVIYNDLNNSYRDLTRAEFDSIVKATPSQYDLLSVYVQFVNTDEVEMNVTSAINIW